MKHVKRAIDRDHLLDKDLIISNDTKVAQLYVLCGNIKLLSEVEKWPSSRDKVLDVLQCTETTAINRTCICKQHIWRRDKQHQRACVALLHQWPFRSSEHCVLPKVVLYLTINRHRLIILTAKWLKAYNILMMRICRCCFCLKVFTSQGFKGVTVQTVSIAAQKGRKHNKRIHNVKNGDKLTSRAAGNHAK